MADRKISELTELAAGSLASGDLIAVVDSSGSETKKVSATSLGSFYNFASRSDADTWVGSNTAPDGTVISDGTVSYTAETGATVISDMAGWVPFGDVYPDHFGENTTPGTTDMASAMQAAINYCPIHLKATSYRFDTGLTISANGGALIGKGPRATTLICGDSGGDLLTIDSSAQFVRCFGFMMEAASGVTVANGIVVDQSYFPVIENIRCNDSDITTHFNVKKSSLNYDTVFRDCFSNVAGTGMAIGRDGTGSVFNVILENVHLNASTVAGMDLRQVGGLQWRGGETLQCERGLLVQPGDGETISGVYISQVHFDTCNNEQLKIAPTHTGASVKFMSFDQCGFNQSVVNHGINIVGPSSDNTVIERIRFSNCEGVINKQHGLNIEYAKLVEALQCDFNGNSRGASGTSHGVRVGPGVERFKMLGGTSGGTDAYPSDQGYGVFISASATDVALIGVDLSDNQTGPITGTPAGVYAVTDCTGVVAKAKGTGTILSGNSSVTISHGLDIVPASKEYVEITLGNNVGAAGLTKPLWCSSLTSTQFTVSANANVTGDFTFGWRIEGVG